MSELKILTKEEVLASEYCFDQKSCFGEVVATSLAMVTVAVWPQREVSFGDIVVIQSNSKLLLGLVTELWQETRESARQIVPLQLSPRELQVTYPHLASLVSTQAKVVIMGNYDSKRRGYCFLPPVACPLLHAWVKNEVGNEVNIVDNAKMPFLKILEKITSENWEPSLKENLFQIIAIKFFEQQKELKQDALDKIYYLAEKVFNGDFMRIATLFLELEKRL